MSRRGAVLAVTLVAVVAGRAAAHVAPSVDDNNRYIKVTPLADRVRLAYTVFFGEIPGAQARQSIDANRDGTIAADEASAFGQQLAAEVAGAADVTVDGVQTKLAWKTVDVGISPETRGGSFSVDLVAWLCVANARGAHALRFRDHFHVPHAGETEIKVEDSPGVTIVRAHVGALDDPGNDFRFVGPAGPLSDDGLDLAFTAGDKAALTADHQCEHAGADRDAHGHRGAVVAAVIGAIVLVGVLLGGWAWYRRRQRR